MRVITLPKNTGQSFIYTQQTDHKIVACLTCHPNMGGQKIWIQVTSPEIYGAHLINLGGCNKCHHNYQVKMSTSHVQERPFAPPPPSPDPEPRPRAERVVVQRVQVVAVRQRLIIPMPAPELPDLPNVPAPQPQQAQQQIPVPQPMPAPAVPNLPALVPLALLQPLPVLPVSIPANANTPVLRTAIRSPSDTTSTASQIPTRPEDTALTRAVAAPPLAESPVHRRTAAIIDRLPSALSSDPAPKAASRALTSADVYGAPGANTVPRLILILPDVQPAVSPPADYYLDPPLGSSE